MASTLDDLAEFKTGFINVHERRRPIAANATS
jgi:hypothetical protein